MTHLSTKSADKLFLPEVQLHVEPKTCHVLEALPAHITEIMTNALNIKNTYNYLININPVTFQYFCGSGYG